MKLLIGLGNPGPDYERTRHNVGFRIVDALAEKQGATWKFSKKFQADITEIGSGENRQILVKPQTFMNASGNAVRAVMDYYKLSPSDVVLVYDDKDLPFSALRMREDGSSAGHNGVQSVIDAIGSGFKRIRIGIANEHTDQHETSDFVLDRFSKDEEAQLPEIIQNALSELS